jgi:hypothetical protein
MLPEGDAGKPKLKAKVLVIGGRFGLSYLHNI